MALWLSLPTGALNYGLYSPMHLCSHWRSQTACSSHWLFQDELKGRVRRQWGCNYHLFMYNNLFNKSFKMGLITSNAETSLKKTPSLSILTHINLVCIYHCFNVLHQYSVNIYLSCTFFFLLVNVHCLRLWIVVKNCKKGAIKQINSLREAQDRVHFLHLPVKWSSPGKTFCLLALWHCHWRYKSLECLSC